MADSDEEIVTDLMLGSMIAFGADIIFLVGFLWAAGYVTVTTFGVVTFLIVAFYAAWIGWRWKQIREGAAAGRSPVEELKYQYANGEISEAEFERKLETLMDDSTSDEGTTETVEPSTERSNR